MAESRRGNGVGKALVSAFVSEVKSRGVKKIFLEVRESNASAIKLYRSAGFTFLSVRKKYYADGENAHIYVLFI